MRRFGNHNSEVDDDLDLIPVMNFFVVLVPLLLLSLSFSKFTDTRIGLAQINDRASQQSETALSTGEKKTIQATLAISTKGTFVKVFTSSFQEGVSGASKRFEIEAVDSLSEYLQALENEEAPLTEILVKSAADVQYQYVLNTIERLQKDLKKSRLHYLSGGLSL